MKPVELGTLTGLKGAFMLMSELASPPPPPPPRILLFTGCLGPHPPTPKQAQIQ